MAQLAIKGHHTQGKEIIETLKMLGGHNNSHNFLGGTGYNYYYIGKYSTISCISTEKIDNSFVTFTFEEFIEKFPYKVGDKVIYASEVFPIIGMKWNCCRDIVIYTMKTNCGIIDCYDNTWMKPYKEETMKEIKIDIPKGYEFAGVNDDKQQVVFTKIQLEYPKTYDECCKVLNTHVSNVTRPIGWKENLISKFQELIICRDAYWEIAGKEMGLGKPWEPDYCNNKVDKHIIHTIKGCVCKDYSFQAITNAVLAFPTLEIMDLFYDNFFDLIESCKDLI